MSLYNGHIPRHTFFKLLSQLLFFKSWRVDSSPILSTFAHLYHLTGERISALKYKFSATPFDRLYIACPMILSKLKVGVLLIKLEQAEELASGEEWGTFIQ